MLREGEVLGGRYRIVRLLGQGGMGSVWEAKHEKLGARVCLKTIAQELSRETEFRQRFELEAQAAARLTGPHVVKVFDVDSTSDGLLYMAMEYLEGTTLGEVAAEAADHPTMLVDWLVQACAGLQEAHDAGLVHRDIKPSNIFLVGTGDERFAKILDFGIAKLQSDAPTTRRPDELRTRTGVILGTIHYMSPEQIRDRALDGRSDVWSLGMVAYRLLTGRYPFHGESEASFLASVVADAPAPIEQLRPDLPRDLCRAIMGALERDPTLRHASAAAFAEALGPFGRKGAALRFSRSGSGPRLPSVDPTTPAHMAPSAAPRSSAPHSAPVFSAEPSTVPLGPPSRPYPQGPELAPTTPLGRAHHDMLAPGTQRSVEPQLGSAHTAAPDKSPARTAWIPILIGVVALAGIGGGITLKLRASHPKTASDLAQPSALTTPSLVPSASSAPSASQAPTDNSNATAATSTTPPAPERSATKAATTAATAGKGKPRSPGAAASSGPAIPRIL